MVLAMASLGGCATVLYVPVQTADGKARAVPVAKTFADAEGVRMAYSGPFGSVTYEADRHVHSEPTRASGEVVKETGGAIGKTLLSYFTGMATLEWVRGSTATNLAKEKTSRHATSEGTTRHVSDNTTTVSLAEIAAE